MLSRFLRIPNILGIACCGSLYPKLCLSYHILCVKIINVRLSKTVYCDDVLLYCVQNAVVVVKALWEGQVIYERIEAERRSICD